MKCSRTRAVDIINPDVANCGGILELKEIAAMAEPHYVAVSPHNYNSTSVALASTVQASACIPNFLITEYFVNFAEKANDITVEPIKVKDGYIELPTAPGLGIELDEGKLEAEEYFQATGSGVEDVRSGGALGRGRSPPQGNPLPLSPPLP